MSSSRNKSNATGLRILWIPGRKRHNHKGKFETTKKNVDYSQKQKKSETWSLGGSKAQKEFLKSDTDSSFIDGSSVPTILPASCVIGAEAAAAVNLNMKTEEQANKSTALEPKEADSANSTDKSIKSDDIEHHGEHKNDFDDSDISHNANTMPLKHKKHRNHNNNQQGDVNSIESITENNCTQPINDFDSIDGSAYNVSRNGGRTKRNKKKKHKSKHDEDEKTEDNELCVNCLYYTCMCCECTIS